MNVNVIVSINTFKYIVWCNGRPLTIINKLNPRFLTWYTHRDQCYLQRFYILSLLYISLWWSLSYIISISHINIYRRVCSKNNQIIYINTATVQDIIFPPKTNIFYFVSNISDAFEAGVFLSEITSLIKRNPYSSSTMGQERLTNTILSACVYSISFIYK